MVSANFILCLGRGGEGIAVGVGWGRRLTSDCSVCAVDEDGG